MTISGLRAAVGRFFAASTCRGPDQPKFKHWSAEVTAKKNIVNYRAGKRIAAWEKRPAARNEAWDLLVMTVILGREPAAQHGKPGA